MTALTQHLARGFMARHFTRPALCLAFCLGASAAASQTASTLLPATSEAIGDWRFECFEVTEDGGPCQIYQRVPVGDTNAVALATAITILADSSVAVQMALPLGIDVRQSPRLSLDEELVAALPVTRCISDGCLIEGTLDETILASLAAAEEAALLVAIPEGNVVPLPFSLTGLTEGLARLEEVRPAPVAAEEGGPGADPGGDTEDGDSPAGAGEDEGNGADSGDGALPEDGEADPI